ncbi:Cell division protein FtsH [Fulvivirga imtechensis AK7]|uniref:Cell division protein FtsH n=1 Tax=Fulvivirga imtechensis AK7 TaxID=1237149 RepID=L8JWT6_9BACT|nr:ATP-binding protein [Fulvivirga imtechensis]ELR72089.1 Cell division protein FtsH [Fulvivirga imtechensis AK7]
MVNEVLKSNAKDLQRELEWFKEILKTRSMLNAKQACDYEDVYDIMPPHLNGSNSEYAKFINKHKLGFEERFLLILSLTPHIKPELLDIFLVKNENTNQIYTEFGGRKGNTHLGFLPTGETAMFILAGSDLEKRFSLQRVFDGSQLLAKESILWLEETEKGEPALSGALIISREVLDLFTLGEDRKPGFSAEFPAKLLSTKMEWSDVVLTPQAEEQLIEIENWIEHHEVLLNQWNMSRMVKPGYRTLFYGPPGTGKTLTAALLGKKTGRDVYRIDLSQMVSKYIGQTEKNLAKVFDRAENKEWILFFDEADALFGNRTSTKDAHDRYANQQVSYLLQRIEDYNGLVILASNLKSNIDEAFMRRFQSMIHFPLPGKDERYLLWKNGFSKSASLGENVDLKDIAEKYEISGGVIINVIQHCSLKAISRQSNEIHLQDIVAGVKREYGKSRRTF